MGPFRLSYFLYVIHIKVLATQAVDHSTFETEIIQWIFSELIADSVICFLVSRIVELVKYWITGQFFLL